METISLILLPVAVLMCAYALTVFIWRARAIAKKQVGAAACMSLSGSPYSAHGPCLADAACLGLRFARLLGRVRRPSACLSLLVRVHALVPSFRQSYHSPQSNLLSLCTYAIPMTALHSKGQRLWQVWR